MRVSATSTDTAAGTLAVISAITILVAGYFQQVTVGYGGSPVKFKRWVSHGLYPAMIFIHVIALILLLV